MPIFTPTTTALLTTLIDRTAANISSPLATSTNETNNALQVVCAWPVSGQYGPGSRVLYYVLVVACVVARKAEWLRNACLAAALLFPAVAAAHGIVLAAVHVDGAVDMDVYGAFQLCSIGILAAPVTVRLSRTYFFDPGRNIIFLWTGLILAGLLGLMVEFYRLKSVDCKDNMGNLVHTKPSQFIYGGSLNCSLACTVENGPHSPLRGGSANNIYVIPSPDKLTFDTATLLAAACCIPAILYLVSMWMKVLEINWRNRFRSTDEDDDERNDDPDGTNGATAGEMKGVNAMIRLWLSALEIPVFGAAILAILILGEMNFFSKQVRYQTEPVASIGQWAPIVGTGLAALGSLYLLLAADLKELDEGDGDGSVHRCDCPHHHCDGDFQVRPGLSYSPSSRDARSIHSGEIENPLQDPTDMQEVDIRRSISFFQSGAHMSPGLSNGEEVPAEMIQTTSRSIVNEPQRSWTMDTSGKRSDVGNRRRVANTLTKIGNYLGTAAHDQLESEFKRGKALDFPEIPGEEHRNRALPQIRERYNQSITPTPDDPPSRAPSFIGSDVSTSGPGFERRSTASRAASPQPQPPQEPHAMSGTMGRRPHASTLSVGRSNSEGRNPNSSQSSDMEGRLRPRRDTLEVPSPVRHTFMRNHPGASQGSGRG